MPGSACDICGAQFVDMRNKIPKKNPGKKRINYMKLSRTAHYLHATKFAHNLREEGKTPSAALVAHIDRLATVSTFSHRV